MALPAKLHGKLRIPVVGAPLFIQSNPELVIAQCKAGIVGSFPALNARPKELLEEWLKRITGELAEYKAKHPEKIVAPFAVNQIVHSSNDRLQHDVDLCEKYQVPIQITSLRAPDDVVKSAHRYGCLVFHDVINTKHAKRALQAGVDGLILVCAGAGGHAGALSPFALVPEVRQFYDGCILLSGSIANGASVLAAQAVGADLAYIGTRFTASQEANASEGNKNCIVESSGEEIVYTNLFTGVHGNYLKRSIAAAGLDPDNLPTADKSTMNFCSGGNMKTKAWRDIWGAGQGVGQIVDIPPATEIVDRLAREYEAARAALVAGQPVPTSLKAAAE
jgi:nitronate monooxygenase